MSSRVLGLFVYLSADRTWGSKHPPANAEREPPLAQVHLGEIRATGVQGSPAL